MNSPPAANTSGLSFTELISISSWLATWSIASQDAPITCGTQRSEYASCTRSQSACEATSALPSEYARVRRAASSAPG